MRLVTEEQSKVAAPPFPKTTARQHRSVLHKRLEEVDAQAGLIVTELRLEDKMLPAAVYASAPGTYARDVYNVLREVTGR